MDISVFVSELFYDHDCVIIPGFGGFICSYRPATINRETHIVSPPSKAISFNRNLQSNDGLLINHIARKNNISFTNAAENIEAWVTFSQSLLSRNEELVLKNTGRLFKDPQGNLQFIPEGSVNYLKSSFGLRSIEAIPIHRAKEIPLEPAHENKVSKRSAWRIAASVLLIAGIAALAQMMWMGVEIRGLGLDQASVAGFVNNIFKTDEHNLKPLPVEAPVVIRVDSVRVEPAVEPLTPEAPLRPDVSPTVTSPVLVADKGQPSYYIIVGAFKEDENAEKVKSKLAEKFGDGAILFERHNQLTKVGYCVGSDITEAHRQLTNAHLEDASYWLMKK